MAPSPPPMPPAPSTPDPRGGAAGADLAGWLRGLNLERYEQAFRDNDIDADVLPDLTDADLRELGLPPGARETLLEAIRALSAPPSPAAAPAEAERRQVTVLFCDLVGSTELAAGMDPEDLREVIRAYHAGCTEVVERFGGRVAKYMGDGVLAYFGYPRAQEDAAERAVRAGLALVEAVAGRPAPRPGIALRTRVGIATGLVVAGRLSDAGGAARDEVVGEALNLAARLQALALPNSVVVAPGTRRLVAGLFDLADLGAHRLKGFTAPVRAWRVLGASAAGSRFEALRGPRPMPLVGRGAELGLLLDRWRRVKEGRGQVVLVAGEPGVGKSRLVEALRERLGGERYTRVAYDCARRYRGSALHPVIAELERAAGFARDDGAGRKLAKLEALLARSAMDVAGAAPLLAALLAIPAGDRYPPLGISPGRQKERTLAALVALLAGLAAREPVLLVFEDAQWSDPTSLELLGSIVERAPGLRLLAVITSRPGFAPPWRGPEHVTALTLGPLSRPQAAAIIARVAGGKPLPAEVLEPILDRTDGVPLFVEELTKAVLESELLRDAGDRYALDGPLPPPAIPATLHDSLLARLDRLAPATRDVAQVAAALGREFSHEVLAAVARPGDAALQDALAQLVEAELIFRHGAAPHATYAFKHRLVQDAAYETLLRSRRRRLHARIARVLEERFPETATAEPELLAHHCAQAGLVEDAVEYRRRAGELATGRSAAAEAVAQLTNGLELLELLPDGPGRDRRELGLRVALGGALLASRGFAAPETGAAWARARELCHRLGDTGQLFRVLYGRYVFHLVRAEPRAALEVGEELLRTAQAQEGDAAALVVGHRAAGAALFELGRLTPARTHLERALALYDPGQHRSLALRYFLDPRVTSLGFLSRALLALGYPDQALGRGHEALAAARELAHPGTLVQALIIDGTLRQLAGRREEALEQAEAGIALAAERGFPHFVAGGAIVRGWALAVAGRPEEGLAELRRGLAHWRAAGAEHFVPYFLALLAEACGEAGRAGEGLYLVGEALARAERTGESWFEAELHRLRGGLLLALPGPAAAEVEGCFRRALAVARAQGARLWELRAATSLARLWLDQGKRAEARDLLASVYGWFTEGFDTPGLRDAKALLDELG